MKVVYNAPVVLTFAFLSFAVLLASVYITPRITWDYFCTSGDFGFASPRFYFTLVSYVLGHASGAHFNSNLMIILLVGPLLEEKNGSRRMVVMILVTAIVTSLLHTLLYSQGILGASGIAFMMLILASWVNARRGEIPLTLVLAVVIHVRQEIVPLLSEDNISHLAHILGGFLGALFGLVWHPKN